MKNQELLNVLVVSDKDNFATTVIGIINENFQCTTEIAHSAVEVVGMVRENSYDLIMINSPINNQLGEQLSRTISKLTYASIVIFTPETIVKRLEEKVSGMGVFIVAKPLKKADFIECVKTAIVASQRSKIFYEENLKLMQKMKELKTIDHAKVLLVEYLKLSEDQAHRYLEQQAMDLRVSKWEVAKNIINTYQR